MGFFAIATAALATITAASMQAQRKTYRIGEEGVKAPKLVSKSEPNYTQEARDAKIEGAVLLSAVIGADGSISDASVIRSLDKGLDRNAVEAIESWVFEPATKDGQPVPVGVKIEVNFRLL